MKLKWPKDRKRAFLWAAEAFGTPYSERTEEQKQSTAHGICFAVDELTDSYQSCDREGIYTFFIYFGEQIGIDTSHWWLRRGDKGWRPSHDNERSDFCSLMAELSHKEFEELAE
jgi:hypothetical protein